MSKQMGSSKWFMWNVAVQGDNLISIIFPKTIMLGEQFEDLRKDPKFEGLVNDLEKLGFEYLKTWINSNSDIIEILNKEK